MARKGGRKRGRKSARYLSPGVYVEEVSSGSRPIEAVGTSVAAFVGIAPLNLRRAAATTLVVALVIWVLGTRRAH
jgi:phage tail sheath protein FI